jgi:hypothetical protein
MPEAVPTAPPPAPTVTSPAVATPGTPEAGQLTLGDLVTRVNAAWADVRSYRATFTGGSATAPPPGGSPAATPMASPAATPLAAPSGSLTSVREVAESGAQRQLVTGAGAADHEAVLLDDRLYVRGPLASQLVPGAGPRDWVSLDPAAVTEGSRLALLLGGLPETPPSPLAAAPERLWAQTVRDLGEVSFDGRQCRTYGAADTVTQTGMRVDYVIAIDERDLPCFIETSAGGTPRGREEYTAMNDEIDIAAPVAATPVAAIPAALATPAARD